jgi:transcriptional regulator NrdR family protein
MQNGTILRCGYCFGTMKICNSRAIIENKNLYKRRRYVCSTCGQVLITKEPLNGMNIQHYNINER